MLSFNQAVVNAMRQAEKTILSASRAGDGWTDVFDEDGNPDLPSTEREVLVFLCGDRDRVDPRPEDAPYGIRIGWFDHDRRTWRVHGEWSRYVTHWRDLPPSPRRIKEGGNE